MSDYLGIDLGGTNVKAGVVDDAGRVRAVVSLPTQSDRGADAVIAVLADAAQRAARDAKVALESIACMGVGSPGIIDFDRGVVVAAGNLPGFTDLPLAQRLREHLGRPVVVANDANAAAMGEFWAGAGRDPAVRHLVMLTLGTGVGSGVVIDGHVVHGAFGAAGEAGHLIVQPGGRSCPCGQHGCLEQYASATAVARGVSEALDAGETSTLASARKEQGGRLTAEQVFAAAQAGDALALRMVDEAAHYLGLACVNFCRLLDPQMVVLAGGMAQAGPFLLDRVRQAHQRQEWSLRKPMLAIRPAELGNDTGVIGAAAVAWDALQREHAAAASSE